MFPGELAKVLEGSVIAALSVAAVGLKDVNTGGLSVIGSKI